MGRLKVAAACAALLVVGVLVGMAKPWPLSAVVDRMKAAQPDVNYLHRTSLFATRAAPADTVMLGDSLTAQNEWSEVLPGAVNRGIFGDTVAGVRRRLTVSVRPQTRRVFLMIGVNDLRRGAKPEAVATEYRRLLTELRGHKVYAQSTLYTRNAKVNGGVAMLDREIAKACGEGLCEYVELRPDLNPGGVLPPRYSVDGVHLNGDAYAIWLRRIRPLL